MIFSSKPHVVKSYSNTCYEISIICIAYNWPEALELQLMSIHKQSVKPHEVIVLDDGSVEVTKSLIAQFKSRLNTSIHKMRANNLNLRNTMKF